MMKKETDGATSVEAEGKLTKGPLVSFVIPVLNGERYIARCLLSIHKQRFPREDYEVVILDNGSTDKTPQIIRDLGFAFSVMPHVNVSALRNYAVSISRGLYIAFVDADVEIMPHWLQNGLVAFADQRVVAVGCFPRVPDSATWVQQTWDVHQRGEHLYRGRRAVSWLPSMNLLVRREAFLAVGGFNERLETAEDVDLCYRLGRRGIILWDQALEAIHWGEAKDLRGFWRKEVWRGTGNLKGVLAHGLRWDELPSIGYPLYMLCLFVLLNVNLAFSALYGRTVLILPNLGLLILPALALAFKVVYHTRKFYVLPQLFLLYFIYGFARAFSLARASALRTS